MIRDLVHDEPNRAKELIEDFMIAANGVTARYLAQKGSPSLRRVLRVPERWDRIVALAGTFGDTLPPEASCEALAKFLLHRRREDPARFPDLSLSVVKLLGRGEYVLELPGQKSEGISGSPSATTRIRRRPTADSRTSSPSAFSRRPWDRKKCPTTRAR